MDESVKSAINIYKIYREKDGNLEEWKKYNKKSLSSGFNDADIFEINKWNKKIKDLVIYELLKHLFIIKKYR